MRSIPAWAGKPWVCSGKAQERRVYPRVGGETRRVDWQVVLQRGLSPRGRGNHGGSGSGSASGRSIPAWAGKPRQGPTPTGRCRVYPRVGGETARNRHLGEGPAGLSPRGRGNPPCPRPGERRQGSIPAWAGKPHAERLVLHFAEVYPRVGGETVHLAAELVVYQGLSPRGRGNHRAHSDAVHARRSIPAWAGKPTIVPARHFWMTVYPRVGGETEWCGDDLLETVGLSPRGRGNPRTSPSRWTARGSIPAWAGKPWRLARIRPTCEVYPRVGGETARVFCASLADVGLSPRGRGNRSR